MKVQVSDLAHGVRTTTASVVSASRPCLWQGHKCRDELRGACLGHQHDYACTASGTSSLPGWALHLPVVLIFLRAWPTSEKIRSIILRPILLLMTSREKCRRTRLAIQTSTRDLESNVPLARLWMPLESVHMILHMLHRHHLSTSREKGILLYYLPICFVLRWSLIMVKQYVRVGTRPCWQSLRPSLGFRLAAEPALPPLHTRAEIKQLAVCTLRCLACSAAGALKSGGS